MKNKKPKNINKLLALASCSLLGSHSLASEPSSEEWDVKNAVLIYSESDDRVQAIETVTNLSKNITEDDAVTITLTFDALTGASPNGASPTDVVQTFTSPSGNSVFLTPAGETPLDDAFKDLRIAMSGNWSKTINRVVSSNIGLALSHETDYDSYGLNSMFSFNTHQNNTTWQVGASISKDVSKPLGGIPIPLLFVFPPSDNKSYNNFGDFEASDSDSKNTFDINLGVTQILGKNTIGQVTFTYSDVDGYQTDPYKIISFIDNDTGSTLFYITENRPDKRKKKGVFTTIKHHNKLNHIINPSFRYYSDDWGIDSLTIEMKYRINLSNKNFIEPKIRYYDQTAADFYAHSLSFIDGLEIASADYRLAEFKATTLGVKFGHELSNQSVFEARLEYYSQNGNDQPDDAIGVQQGLDLFAEVNALILQFNYNFSW